jgi:hypothetical protein
MRTVISSVIIMIISIAFNGCSKNQEKQSLMSIQSFVGTVKKATQNSDQFVKIGDIIVEGDTITTGAKSTTDISVGQAGVIRINEKTTIKIDSLVKNESLNTRLDIQKGRAFFVFSKLNKDDSCIVKTPTAIAAVRGTSFRVSAEGDSSRIDVVSGKVLVSPVNNGIIVKEAEVVLEKNDTVVLDTAAVTAIVDKKKSVEVKTISPAVMKQIISETKEIAIAPDANQSLKTEVQKNFEQPKASIEKPKHSREYAKKAADEAKRKMEEEAREAAALKAEKEKSEKDKAMWHLYFNIPK